MDRLSNVQAAAAAGSSTEKLRNTETLLNEVVEKGEHLMKSST